ncbi:MAG: hypothetical protein NTY03_11305, partial [Candidatus Bathyarchaeota archaeon]|nr:hypothetical protein [Candidatus Bathyarchaeota archaeon]
IVWAPVALLLVIWRRDSIPYVAALLQHIVVGDIIIGSLPLLFPLSGVRLGLELAMSSLPDALIEFSSLLVMVIVMLRSGDLGRLMAGGRQGLLVVVPLASMVSLTWFAWFIDKGSSPSVIQETVRVVDYGFSNEALLVITIGHFLLTVVMISAVVMAILNLLPDSHRARLSLMT